MAVRGVPEGRITATGGVLLLGVRFPPPAMAVTVVPEGRLTWTGMLLSAVVPLPSWPNAFQPQARTWPLEVSARLSPPPPAMAVTVVPEGRLTATGVLLLVVVPLPSWPLTL